MTGANKNVIKVLRHGVLPTSHYYIDMSLCLYNLRQYYLERMWQFDDLSGDQPGLPLDRAPRMRTAWGIMKQIAEGVKFIHAQGFVHRDLKPVNGEPSLLLQTKIVLFNGQDNRWKVADFGLTQRMEGSSGNNTQEGRGTEGYRAPEMVVPVMRGTAANYTEAVDIFAMGCILYEICYRTKAFQNDVAVQQYHRSRTPPRFPAMPGVQRTPSFLDEGQLQEVILRLLSINPTQRPSASALCGIFTIPGNCFLFRTNVARARANNPATTPAGTTSGVPNFRKVNNASHASDTFRLFYFSKTEYHERPVYHSPRGRPNPGPGFSYL
jgi:serine/threonine protein kinase